MSDNESVMIPDEAVDAAARSMYGRLAMTKWEDLGPLTRQNYLDAARRSLEAAAPFIAAAGFARGYVAALAEAAK